MITFWITFGVQFDFLENNSEICDIGSREDQKLTYAQFCEMGIRMHLYPKKFENFVVHLSEDLVDSIT